ncbi:MAG: hypothetical protein ACE5OZ_00520 [Candidatus Heimdallarchaeota archaeon]
MIRKLESWPSRKQIDAAIVVAIVSLLIIFILMQVVSEPIQTESSYNVLDLEFAWTSEKMNTILDDWGNDLIEREIWATYFDFGFLVAYGTLLAGLSLRFGRLFKEEKLGYLGYRFTIISYIASGFDAIENFSLLWVLHFPKSYPNFTPLLASICATIKFTLIICTVAYILIASLTYAKLKLTVRSSSPT